MRRFLASTELVTKSSGHIDATGRCVCLRDVLIEHQQTENRTRTNATVPDGSEPNIDDIPELTDLVK